MSILPVVRGPFCDFCIKSIDFRKIQSCGYEVIRAGINSARFRNQNEALMAILLYDILRLASLMQPPNAKAVSEQCFPLLLNILHINGYVRYMLQHMLHRRCSFYARRHTHIYIYPYILNLRFYDILRLVALMNPPNAKAVFAQYFPLVAKIFCILIYAYSRR